MGEERVNSDRFSKESGRLNVPWACRFLKITCPVASDSTQHISNPANVVEFCLRETNLPL